MIKKSDEGVWLDSGWPNSWFAHLVHIAVDQGWNNRAADELADRYLQSFHPSSTIELSIDDIESLKYSAELATKYLNSKAPKGFMFRWVDGEFRLVKESCVSH